MANRLSKSRFQTGLQCPKALWLSTHARDLADPTSDTQQHIFDTGTMVGELARERFADGILVAEDHTQSAQALETTRRLLENPPNAIFEAALEYGGVFVRPDVLVRVGDNLWDLYEVKSTTRVKAVHITDIAVQTWVLEGAGLPIRRAYLMHLDNTYTYPGGEYDLDRLFRASDVTVDARAYLPQVPTLVAEMIAMLDVAEAPAVPIGKQCTSPYTCAYFGSCHEFLPAKPVTELPKISESLLDALIADGIFAIEDVPLDYPELTYGQREVCELVRSGEPHIVGDIDRSLAGLTYPIHFLDFETFLSALPLIPGTRPWQAIPFQWSDHILHEDGDLEHRAFPPEGTRIPPAAFPRLVSPPSVARVPPPPPLFRLIGLTASWPWLGSPRSWCRGPRRSPSCPSPCRCGSSCSPSPKRPSGSARRRSRSRRGPQRSCLCRSHCRRRTPLQTAVPRAGSPWPRCWLRDRGTRGRTGPRWRAGCR